MFSRPKERNYSMIFVVLALVLGMNFHLMRFNVTAFEFGSGSRTLLVIASLLVILVLSYQHLPPPLVFFLGLYGAFVGCGLIFSGR